MFLQTVAILHVLTGVAVVCQFGKMAVKRPLVNVFQHFLSREPADIIKLC